MSLKELSSVRNALSKELTNFDILDLMKGHPGWRGVFMRDGLDKLKISPGDNGVINLDSSKGNGTHWVCFHLPSKVPKGTYLPSKVPKGTYLRSKVPNGTYLRSKVPKGTYLRSKVPKGTYLRSKVPKGTYNDTDSEYVEYFDSFGLPPPLEVEAFLRKTGKKILFNSSQLQHPFSVACGYYCIYYLKNRLKYDPYEILYRFEQFPTFENDKKLASISEPSVGAGLGDFTKYFSVNNLLGLNLPEMHLPTVDDQGNPRISSFCGPFTKLDKRLADFDPKTGKYSSVITPPVNKLDQGCLVHDIEYSKHGDVDNRNIADDRLAKVAAEVAMNSPYFAQRVGAKLVKKIMETKVKNKF